MQGYKLHYGIWNFDHSITSRDISTPSVYKTTDELNKYLKESKRFYASIGYEIWFKNITEIDIRLCDECGKHCEAHNSCWYCGAE